jgi:hypothetical protein
MNDIFLIPDLCILILEDEFHPFFSCNCMPHIVEWLDEEDCPHDEGTHIFLWEII